MWLYHDFGIRGLFVYSDELIGMHKEQNSWLKEISEGIVGSGLDIKWRCQGRCNPAIIEQETLDAMQKAGCRTIMWGCESGSQRVLDIMRKGIKVENIAEVFRMTKKANMRNFGFFMVGNYGETEEDLKMTFELVKKLRQERLLDAIQVSIVTPAKGSDLWKICEDEGLLLPASSHESGRAMYDVVWRNPNLSEDTIRRWRDAIDHVRG
jgi:radical SAM superfamily enzyme YgiQ (UPF0313 family)